MHMARTCYYARMLSLFPSALSYGFFAPTIVRCAAGITFLYIAITLVNTRIVLQSISNLPIVGRMRPWMIWTSAAFTAVVGAALVAGLFTQAAAIVGALIALKHALGYKKYRAYLPLSLGTYLLLMVICISIIVTGAGAFAFDLPL